MVEASKATVAARTKMESSFSRFSLLRPMTQNKLFGTIAKTEARF
jgi:hypothetical protein